MKKLLAICVFVLLNLNAYAQQGTIKINPLSLIVKTLNIQGEIQVTKNQTFQLGLFYLNRNYNRNYSEFFGSDGIKYFKEAGFGITPEYRFYFTSKKIEHTKYYIGAYYRILNFDISERVEYTGGYIKPLTYNTNMFISGGGIIFGSQLTYNFFVFDIYIGAQYIETKFSNTENSVNRRETPYLSNFFLDRIGPRFGMAIGLSNMK